MDDIQEKVIQIAKKENCKPRYKEECDGLCNNCHILARLLHNPKEPIHFAEPKPENYQLSYEELDLLEGRCMHGFVD